MSCHLWPRMTIRQLGHSLTASCSVIRQVANYGSVCAGLILNSTQKRTETTNQPRVTLDGGASRSAGAVCQVDANPGTVQDGAAVGAVNQMAGLIAPIDQASVVHAEGSQTRDRNSYLNSDFSRTRI